MKHRPKMFHISVKNVPNLMKSVRNSPYNNVFLEDLVNKRTIPATKHRSKGGRNNQYLAERDQE